MADKVGDVGVHSVARVVFPSASLQEVLDGDLVSASAIAVSVVFVEGGHGGLLVAVYFAPSMVPRALSDGWDPCCGSGGEGGVVVSAADVPAVGLGIGDRHVRGANAERVEDGGFGALREGADLFSIGLY